jgi:hypothetical protein
MTVTIHSYEVPPRKDGRGFDLISDQLPFGGLWYLDPAAAVGYAKFYSRSHPAIIRVFDKSGIVIETHEHQGDFKEWQRLRANEMKDCKVCNGTLFLWGAPCPEKGHYTKPRGSRYAENLADRKSRPGVPNCSYRRDRLAEGVPSLWTTMNNRRRHVVPRLALALASGDHSHVRRVRRRDRDARTGG